MFSFLIIFYVWFCDVTDMLRHFYIEGLFENGFFQSKGSDEINAPDDLLSKWQDIFDPVLIMH